MPHYERQSTKLLCQQQQKAWGDATINGYPVFFGEILSKLSLDLTVGELERNLLDSLRLYRNFNTEIKSVRGIVLPAYVRDMKLLSLKEQRREDKKKCPPLMVTLKWVVEFTSELSDIHYKDIIPVITNIITDNLHWTSKFEQVKFSGFFLPVSPQYLTSTFGLGAMQIPSGVVITYNSSVYKLIVSAKRLQSYQQELFGLKKAIEATGDDGLDKYLFIPEPELLHCGLFLKTPKLLFPLLKEEAALCLRDFLHLSAKALSSLHDLQYVHNDIIRLENICFKQLDLGVIAVLIDMEMMSKPNFAESMVSIESSMGRKPTSCEGDKFGLDWKQFGLMAAYILEQRHIKVQYHDIKFEFSASQKYAFVSLLINKGESLLFNEVYSRELWLHKRYTLISHTGWVIVGVVSTLVDVLSQTHAQSKISCGDIGMQKREAGSLRGGRCLPIAVEPCLQHNLCSIRALR